MCLCCWAALYTAFISAVGHSISGLLAGELTDQHMTNNRDMLERWGKAPRLIGWCVLTMQSHSQAMIRYTVPCPLQNNKDYRQTLME